MHIVLLLGSPHRNGTTAALAKAFKEGAESAGHTVESIYVPGENIHPCLSCGGCRNTGKCVQNDGGNALVEKLLKADGIVFASPLFYFNFTAQLKTVIDRFYCTNGALRETNPRVALLTAGADDDKTAFAAITVSYETICNYMHFKDVGTVTALGCASPAAEKMPLYLEAAKALGAAF